MRSPCRLMLALLLALVAGSPLRAQEKSKFDQLTDGKKKYEGMWTLFNKEQQLLVELKNSQLDKDFIVIPTIARGISMGHLIGGMSWNYDDQLIWTFRKTDEKIFVLRRNVRYRATDDSPEASAVKIAYSDSVLYALPILATTPGGVLIDMTSIFMSDDQQIGAAIGPGFRFMSDRSTWGKIKNFESNLELEVAAVYAGFGDLEKVPDSRGVQVSVHYSIRQLAPVGANGYKPRIADDRVGYFLTALKDFSDKTSDEHFVRYINRWDLKKKDPDVDLSPPAKPILFYMERTVPIWLRPTVKAGILEWNKAFEKLGFSGAVEVRQQEDNDTWDPEDINYNTFRWITADAGFAIGPSRVDPRTGQILDADILFDAGFLDYWKRDYETFTPEAIARLAPNWTPFESLAPGNASAPLTFLPGRHGCGCLYCQEHQQQMGLAAATMMVQGIQADGKLPPEFIHQALKEVVMHEVGHTLGLRHNFKASAWKTLDEMADLEKGKAEGIVGSVMDYAPPNIAADKTKQGLYYTQTVGPYDIWAIEYGYKLVKANDELAKIAARSTEPGLDYLTDEDTRGTIDSDPLANRFDLGKDPIAFARRQMQQSVDLLPKIVERTVKEGDGYQRARQAFGLLFSEYWRTAAFASRFPGGLYVTRDHKAANSRPTFQVVEAAKQREAMKLVVETAFAAPKLDGKELNLLASSRWSHWGAKEANRLDFPVHEMVAQSQGMILRRLTNTTILQRILDSEFKTAAEADSYTLAEHFRMLADGVFSEWRPAEAPKGEFTRRASYIHSFRRNLQRMTLTELTKLVNENSGAPEDARTLARMHLGDLVLAIDALFANGELKLDDYSRAHLEDCRAKIRQALNAQVTLPAGSDGGRTLLLIR